MNQEDKDFELLKLQIEHDFQARQNDADRALELDKIIQQLTFDAGKEYARQTLEYALQHDRHLKDYGQMALRSAFLLNGGAIISILTFIGATAGKTVANKAIVPALFVPSFASYAVGLIGATISMTFAYLNYLGHKNSKADPGDLANNMMKMKKAWPANNSVSNSRLIDWSWYLAMIFGVSSIILFGAGCYEIVRVFEVLK
jgi:hypothetical protein